MDAINEEVSKTDIEDVENLNKNDNKNQLVI